MKDPKVFVDSYQFTISLFHRTKSFPRALRPTLGRRLEEQSIEMTQSLRKALLYSVRADSRGSLRLQFLKSASQNLDELRVLLKLSRDLSVLPISGFEELSILSREIGREIGGLIKHGSKK